jgi:hypothetical protein
MIDRTSDPWPLVAQIQQFLDTDRDLRVGRRATRIGGIGGSTTA